MKPIEERLIVPNLFFGHTEYCTYCGAIPDTQDHVIPLSQYKAGLRKGRENNGIRTYACRRCNMQLGDSYFPLFADRCRHIQMRRIEIAHAHSKKPIWDKDEIDKLQYALRNHVAKEQAEADRAEFEASWQYSSAFQRCLRNLRSSPYVTKDHPKFKAWLYDYFEGYLNQ